MIFSVDCLVGLADEDKGYYIPSESFGSKSRRENLQQA